MKYAVIGTGWIAEEFIKGTKLIDGLEFSAIYSRSEEKGRKFASQFGVDTVYTDLAEFARGDFEAVYIASPNSLHFEQSRLMLENGKHVLCEKPITVEPDEFSLLRRLADEKNLIYTEAIMYLHLPARKILKEAVSEIGKISSAKFDFSQLSSKYPALLRGENPNIFNPAFATGCLMDLGIYCIYPALDLFGTPDEIICDAGFLSTGADSYGTTVMKYFDKSVTLTYSKIGQSRSSSEILGDKGTVTTSSISKLEDIILYDNDGNEKCLIGKNEKSVFMSYEAESFLRYITNPDKMQEYNENNDMIFKVSCLMKEIREKSGIKFL